VYAGHLLSQGEAIIHSDEESPMAATIVTTAPVRNRNLPSPFPVS
jgi:hypothetical protein